MTANNSEDDTAKGAGKRPAQRSGPEQDARGQSEKNHKGGSNDGVSSADPRVISGEEEGDATFPLDQDKAK